jgi:hypothetical protein
MKYKYIFDLYINIEASVKANNVREARKKLQYIGLDELYHINKLKYRREKI